MMPAQDHDRRIARAMWPVAVGMIGWHDPDVRPLAWAALERPCAETITPLLHVSEGKQWRPLLVDVLMQIGIAAAHDILGDEP